VRQHVEGRFDPLRQCDLRGEHGLQQLARRLHGALGPAELLRAERGHVLGQLGRREHVGPVNEAPANELRAVRKV
jgi:hypothetical protein